jgi:hypothetical protein
MAAAKSITSEVMGFGCDDTHADLRKSNPLPAASQEDESTLSLLFLIAMSLVVISFF